jgi:hypothetical protein
MNNVLSYQLSSPINILSHYPFRQFVVRDTESDADMLRKARIRSGDYLMTLATELESIAQQLSDVKAPEAPELERIVSELIYLERNYTISPRLVSGCC